MSSIELPEQGDSEFMDNQHDPSEASINVGEMLRDCEILAFKYFGSLDEGLTLEIAALAHKHKMPPKVIVKRVSEQFEKYLIASLSGLAQLNETDTF